MTNRAKRQHTVSRFYLRGFANTKDQVRRVTIPDETSAILATSDASVIKDFYSFELENGTLSDAFEREMSTIEAAASRALSQIEIGEWPIAGPTRDALSTWISLQYLRGEDPRASQTELSAQMIRLIVGISGKDALRSHIENSLGRKLSDAEIALEWEDLTKPGGPDLQSDTKLHIRTMLDMWPGMSRYLFDSHWTLIRFRRKSLVTSDHPVTISVDQNYPNHHGVGVATADMFSIPLSRRLALNIQPRHRLERQLGDGNLPDFRVDGTTRISLSFNQQTTWEARRYIFSHPEDIIDSRIAFPKQAERSRVGQPDSDHLILEDGLPMQSSTAHSKASLDDALADGSRGFSLEDLPWPIPGRLNIAATE